MSSNVIPMRPTADTTALWEAIPNKAPERDMFSAEANALYEALAMMPPAERDAAIAATGDEMLPHYYDLWLRLEAGQ